MLTFEDDVVPAPKPRAARPTPETIRERIAAYADAGVQELVLGNELSRAIEQVVE